MSMYVMVRFLAVYGRFALERRLGGADCGCMSCSASISLLSRLYLLVALVINCVGFPSTAGGCTLIGIEIFICRMLTGDGITTNAF
jgi:hypothetical protein